MSIHRSLYISSKLMRHRNVYTRAERVLKLKEEGKWKEGDSIYGLPKVSTGFKLKKSKGGKSSKKKEDEK